MFFRFRKNSKIIQLLYRLHSRQLSYIVKYIYNVYCKIKLKKFNDTKIKLFKVLRIES